MQNLSLRGEKVVPVDFKKVLSGLSVSQRAKIAENYDMDALSVVFSNEGLMAAIEAFLKNGMNVSLTARALYMHRNTLIYKLNAVKKITGFDLKKFDMAATFSILHALYALSEEHS